MMTFLYLVGGVLMVWFGFYIIRKNPDVFSRDNLGKSFYTLGILGLLLIAVVWVCVKILR